MFLAAAPYFAHRFRSNAWLLTHFQSAEVSVSAFTNFVGRKTELQRIPSYFSISQTTQPPCLIQHALGGQGKSQIALEYCRRSRETYRGIFWINAHSEVSVSQSYRTVASALTRGRSADASDNDAQTRLAKDSPESWSEPWLLVFDNYDDPKNFPNVKRFIPTGRQCSEFNA